MHRIASNNTRFPLLISQISLLLGRYYAFLKITQIFRIYLCCNPLWLSFQGWEVFLNKNRNDLRQWSCNYHTEGVPCDGNVCMCGAAVWLPSPSLLPTSKPNPYPTGWLPTGWSSPHAAPMHSKLVPAKPICQISGRWWLYRPNPTYFSNFLSRLRGFSGIATLLLALALTSTRGHWAGRSEIPWGKKPNEFWIICSQSLVTTYNWNITRSSRIKSVFWILSRRKGWSSLDPSWSIFWPPGVGLRLNIVAKISDSSAKLRRGTLNSWFSTWMGENQWCHHSSSGINCLVLTWNMISVK